MMTSSSEGELLQVAQLIRERWKIKMKIGGGGFGEIYEANDIQNHNERVAVKVESSKATKQVLKMEVAVLRRLQGKRHACKFYGCGRNEKFNYLVMSLQGKNLADLRRESPRQCFSLSTAIRIGIQILAAIREIHSIGFLHRDIKPSNFAMGRTTSTMRCVYMLDFGLARQYLNAKGEIRSPRSAAGFRGTVRYAAVSAHKNKEMGRQDDLWSLFYMLVEFIHGSLPWRKIKDKDEVGRLKDELNLDVFLEGCPRELHDFALHLRTLSYPDEPNYELLEMTLKTILIKYDVNFEEPYDWEMGYENIGGGKLRANGTPAPARNRSHTTAVKDRGPEDKNRALDTQAPITMGDEDDEQTGIHGKCQMIICDKEHHDKPKYKQKEFMRPKYGAVSFDVIDAVNARLAAVSGNADIFNNLRVETSVENNEKRNGDAEVNPTNMKKLSQDEDANAGVAHVSRPKITTQLSNERTNKSNRSITLSAGKRYNKKLAPQLASSAEGTYAQADDDAGVSCNLKAQSIISRWHSSFEESIDDGEHPNGAQLEREKSDSSIGTRSPLLHDRYARVFPRCSPLLHANRTSECSLSPSSPSTNNNYSATMSPLAAHRARRMNTQPTISVVTPPIHVTAQPIQIPLRIAAPSFHVVPATPPQTSSSMQPEHHIQVTTSSSSTHQHADHQTAPPASKPVFTSPTAATQPTAAFTATTTPTPTVYQHSPRQSRSSAHHFPHQQHQLQQQTQPMALKTSSQSTSSSIMSHFKNLVNSFNALANPSSSSASPRRRMSRGVSLDNARTPLIITTASSTPSVPSYSTSTQQANSASLTATKVVASTINAEEEKEMRRQRRFRRRSDTQGMIPNQKNTLSSQESVKKADNGIVPKSIFLSKTNNASSPKETANTKFSPNNNSPNLWSPEVIEQTPLDDSKKTPISYRKKRYQFLNFSPRTASKT